MFVRIRFSFLFRICNPVDMRAWCVVFLEYPSRRRITMMKKMVLISVLSLFALSLCAAELKPVKLPAPRTDAGKSLMESLKERKSSREFNKKKLPPGVLSNLLWAACGINRPDSGKLTAPSASDHREIDVYVASSEGLFLYDAKGHALMPVLDKDVRALTGKQPFAGEAPVDLVYVADLSRMGGNSPEEKNLYSATDTGFISENVYLYCASEGLATVVRGSIDRESLAKAMGLRENQKIILAQTIGYPASISPQVEHGVFNLNKVEYEELKTLPLLDDKMAKKIIDYRFEHGSFTSINDLIKVRGMTWDLLHKIKPYLALEGQTTFDPGSFQDTGH
jgi:nitroreductase